MRRLLTMLTSRTGGCRSTAAAEISPQKARLESAKPAYDQAVANCNLAKSRRQQQRSSIGCWRKWNRRRTNLDNLLQSFRSNDAGWPKCNWIRPSLALEQAQQQLDKARIVAPFDGVVTQVNAVVGGPSSSGTIVLADDSQLSCRHVDR